MATALHVAAGRGPVGRRDRQGNFGLAAVDSSVAGRRRIARWIWPSDSFRKAGGERIGATE